jgi:hypothetical protein
VARVSEMFLEPDPAERSDDLLRLESRGPWICPYRIHQKSSLGWRTTFVREMSHDHTGGYFVVGGQVRFRSA